MCLKINYEDMILVMLISTGDILYAILFYLAQTPNTILSSLLKTRSAENSLSPLSLAPFLIKPIFEENSYLYISNINLV